MKQKDIDFRELIERLLPLDQLLPGDRLRVHRALAGGVGVQIEQAALSALSQLEQAGALKRLRPIRSTLRASATSAPALST